jgi:hypothetical protein
MTGNTSEPDSEVDASIHDQRTEPFQRTRQLPRVVLCVRDLTPTGLPDRQKAVYEQLLQLQEDGRIADVSVEVWGKQMYAAVERNPAADASARAARSTYEAFEAWAERNGHDLSPAFSTHTVSSLVSDEQTEVIRFPVMCLAVYDADDLLAVAPCSTSEGISTVDDCLEALRSGKWTSHGVEVGD